MVRWDDEHHVIFHERLDLEVVAEGWALDKGELNAAGGECLEHLVGVAADRGDSHFWMTFAKGGDEAGKQVSSDGLRGSYEEIATLLTMGGGDGNLGFIGERLQLFSERDQGLASRRELNVASTAIEERHAELVFQRLDLVGDGRLRHQEFFSGPAEIEVPGDGTEDAEAEVFDHVRLCVPVLRPS